MSADAAASFATHVARHAPALAKRALIAASLDALAIARLRLAVVFVQAEWSGPSCVALRALDAALGDAVIDVVIVSIDADGDGVWFRRELGIAPQGAGETAWIRDGIVRTRMSSYGPDDARAIRAMTEAVAAGRI